MNAFRKILFCLAIPAFLGLTQSGCETTGSNTDAMGRPEGIAAPQGNSREDLIQAQDRAFRQLAF